MITWKFCVTVLVLCYAWLKYQQSKLAAIVQRHAELTERLAKTVETLKDQQIEFMKIVYGRWDTEDKALAGTDGPAPATLVE